MTMAPKAKKLLAVLLPIYVVVIGLFIYSLATKEEPEDKPLVLERIEKAFSESGKPISMSKAGDIYDQFYRERGGIISIQLYTILMQILNFGLLLVLLYGFVWNPLLKFLDSRREGIREDIESGRTSRAEGHEVLKTAQEEVAKSRLERTSLRERAQRRAEAERKEILAAARQDAEKLIEAARRETAAEIDEAYSQLRKQLGHLAVTAAAKILKREIREEDHEKLLEDFVRQIEDQPLHR